MAPTHACAPGHHSKMLEHSGQTIKNIIYADLHVEKENQHILPNQTTANVGAETSPSTVKCLNIMVPYKVQSFILKPSRPFSDAENTNTYSPSTKKTRNALNLYNAKPLNLTAADLGCVYKEKKGGEKNENMPNMCQMYSYPHRTSSILKVPFSNASSAKKTSTNQCLLATTPALPPLTTLISTIGILLLFSVISPSQALPLRQAGRVKNLTPRMVEGRDLILCWVVEIQTHASHCGDVGGADAGCGVDGRVRSVEASVEHAEAVSKELGLEIHHSFDKFHSHILLCNGQDYNQNPTQQSNVQLNNVPSILSSTSLPSSSSLKSPKSLTAPLTTTSASISQLHQTHSDLRVKDRPLFDLLRQQIEARLNAHPEVLTFSSEHVHRRKSRLAIPARQSKVDTLQLSERTFNKDPQLTAGLDSFSKTAGTNLLAKDNSAKDAISKIAGTNLVEKDNSPKGFVSQTENALELALNSNPIANMENSAKSDLELIPNSDLASSANTTSISSKLTLEVKLKPKMPSSESFHNTLSPQEDSSSHSVNSITSINIQGKYFSPKTPKNKQDLSNTQIFLDSADPSHSNQNTNPTLNAKDFITSKSFDKIEDGDFDLPLKLKTPTSQLRSSLNSPVNLFPNSDWLVSETPSSSQNGEEKIFTNAHRLLSMGSVFSLNQNPKQLKLLKSLKGKSIPKALSFFKNLLFRTEDTYNSPNFLNSHLVRSKDAMWAKLRRKRFALQRMFPSVSNTLPGMGPMSFNDPAYPRQWHLYNRATPGMDINVTGVWRHGYTGRGVTVAIVDDGVEWRNPDLKANYNYKGSWDLNDNDPDPSPSYTKMSNHHGTRCAGEIAAVANNKVCGVGVAYGASVAGVRVLDGVMTDSMEAEAFNKNMDINSVFSCSWGPDDDGKTVDGPHLMAAKAMKFGVDFGRGGFGSIFVVASGNGGEHGDNCNFDGYANSIYTVTIGAVDEDGGMPYYAEECASMLGVTFSSGTLNKRDIVTTDWNPMDSNGGGGLETGGLGLRSSFGEGYYHVGGGLDFVDGGGDFGDDSGGGVGVMGERGPRAGSSGGGCTERHTGTSAAAPLAAGIVALMLEARPCLTWRDVQYVVALTARKVDVDVAHWQSNGAGLEHSHKHGFGLLSAWRMVNAARVWKTVPWLTSYSVIDESSDWQIPKGRQSPLVITREVTERDIQGLSLFILENVQLTVWMSHPSRGHLEVKVISPAGTISVLAAVRPKDNSSSGFHDWTFTTVRCWGETPTGNWTILVFDHDEHKRFGEGSLNKYRLTLFGTPMTPQEFRERRHLVEKSMSGEFLHSNYSLNCQPPPKYQSVYAPVSVRALKILILSGIFLMVMALYESLEYLFCYDDEKKETMEKIKRARLAAQMASDAMTVVGGGSGDELLEQSSALLPGGSGLNTNGVSSHSMDNNESRTNLFVDNEEEEEEEDEHYGISDRNSSETRRLLLSSDLVGARRGLNITRGNNSILQNGAGSASPLPQCIPLKTFNSSDGKNGVNVKGATGKGFRNGETRNGTSK